MKFFNTLAIALLALSTAPFAQAGISRNYVTRMALAVHGIYVTSDPFCQTGFSATLPISSTASTLDFTRAPTLGRGAMPSSVGCVLILFEDNVGLDWVAGNYTTSTEGSSDNVCNAGGTVEQKICRSTPIAFPAQVSADAAAAGITLLGACPASPTGHEIVPMYLSTLSACNGGPTQPYACKIANGGDGANVFAAPTVAGDTTKGLLLGVPAAGAVAYTFVTDPDGVAVGNDGGHCGSIGPPLFSFRSN